MDPLLFFLFVFVTVATIGGSWGWVLLSGKRPKNRILGTELSGVIAAVGSRVGKWMVGEPGEQSERLNLWRNGYDESTDN